MIKKYSNVCLACNRRESLSSILAFIASMVAANVRFSSIWCTYLNRKSHDLNQFWKKVIFLTDLISKLRLRRTLWRRRSNSRPHISSKMSYSRGGNVGRFLRTNETIAFRRFASRPSGKNSTTYKYYFEFEQKKIIHW